jgi:hypothetical protein
MTMKRLRALAALAPLFLVSLATVGFEIALTRYFAVAKWSEYGYWVISIVLAGFAFSGVALALAREFFTRHGDAFLAWLPTALILSAAAGFYCVTINPFNPLQLQNPATLWPQIGLIFIYYAALFPFFFLAGLFVSLCFVRNDTRLGLVYGYDLTGAGVGSMIALGLMAVVHPFQLLPCLLVPLALAAAFAPRWRVVLPAALVALALAEVLLLAGNQASYNDFKAIYAPLHTPGAKVLGEIRSARGLYTILDDFTERVDTDLSNNAGEMGIAGPPATLGLYRDGNRITALPRPPGTPDMRYAAATLASLPYRMEPGAHALLVGSSGGFHPAEALALGVGRPMTVLEPEPVLRGMLRGPDGKPFASGRSPMAAVPGMRYDLIDFAGDFLDTAEANQTAFAAEAVASYLGALSHDGILSIPVSIREFPAYAVRMLATVRDGLRQAGIAEPWNHVLVYRSAWNVRILVSPEPFDAARIDQARQFCAERSFDLSYFPGIEAAPRTEIFNDLPPVSFSTGEVAQSDKAQDAIAGEAPLVMHGQATESGRAFDLRPITYDRPEFYNVLRLSQIGHVLARLEILPQPEIGALVNLAVLGQAVVIALLVLAVPLVAGRRVRAEGISAPRAAIYFATLGLGFLFIELYAIDRASFYLNDRTSGFAIVLTAMLVFSGLGSLLSSRFASMPRHGIDLAMLVIVAWGALVYFTQEDAILRTLDWPYLYRAAMVIAAVAPVSMALGLPFPLGLSRAGKDGFMPWAWGLNGAFSVVSTPLANLIAWQAGHSAVLISALSLYVIASAIFPRDRKNLS